MANITDQFVTSFSELHINAATVANNISDTNVRNFFTGGVVASTFDADANLITLGTTTEAEVVALGDVAFVRDTTGTAIYFDVSAISSILTTAVADLDALVLLGAVFVGAQIPLVMEIGTLSNEATVIDTPTFGEQFRGKLRGQLDGGQLDTQLYWVPRNFVHSFLRNLAESGTALSVGIKWNSDSAGTDSEFVVFNSFVSSFGIDTTFDDVAKVSATLVVDGAEHFADFS